jgi:hypothetical protein
MPDPRKGLKAAGRVNLQNPEVEKCPALNKKVFAGGQSVPSPSARQGFVNGGVLGQLFEKQA